MAGVSSIVFDDATIPDVDEEVAGTGSGLFCEAPGCGKELTYGGRGRKPKFCDDHKRGSSSGKATSTRGSGNVESAVNTLDTLYATLTAGFMLFGLQEAATNLAGSRDYLAAQNRMFLSKDPKLAAAINKMGATGGRFGFFAVQVMTLGPVMVTAAGEIRSRQVAKNGEQTETETGPIFAGFGDASA